MTLKDFNTQMDNALKRYIKALDHIDTGYMIRTVKFNSTNLNGVLQIKFKATDYMRYLDKGGFIDSFFELESTKKIIGQYYTSFYEEFLFR